MSDDWTEVDVFQGPIEVRAVMQRLGSRQDRIRCFVQPLRFYSNALLFRYDGARSRLYGVACMEGATWLTGEAEEIHAFNAVQKLRITATTVVDYAKFFCRFLRDGDRWFTLLEENAPISPTYCGRDIDGRFLVDGCMRIEGTVYCVRLAVDEVGGVDMVEDSSMAA